MRGLSLVVASGGHSSSQCPGLSLSRPLLLQSTGSRRAGSVIVAHGPSCSAARGIFPDQGLNPCPLHWQADSQPLHHQGSPRLPLSKILLDINQNHIIEKLFVFRRIHPRWKLNDKSYWIVIKFDCGKLSFVQNLQSISSTRNQEASFIIT